MFKQVAVLILLAALTAQTLNNAAIVMSYYTNTASYAANCENKAKPMLHCNGRCQLMKKLKGEENKEKQNPSRRFANKNEVISSKSFFTVLDYFLLTTQQLFPPGKITGVRDIAGEFFHPPGIVPSAVI